MKFQRCDKCGKERPEDKESGLGLYDTVTFGSISTPAETFDVCPVCRQQIRAMFPMGKPEPPPLEDNYPRGGNRVRKLIAAGKQHENE